MGKLSINHADAGLPSKVTDDIYAGVTPCNNGALRMATRNLGQLFDGVLSPCGLRASQFGILAYINGLEAPTMKRLAKALVMDLSALGHTLKPLVRDGYVALTPDLADRRSKRVTLTEAGRAKYLEGVQFWLEAQGRFETAFGAEKAARLREALDLVASDPFSEAYRSAGAAAR